MMPPPSPPAFPVSMTSWRRLRVQPRSPGRGRPGSGKTTLGLQFLLDGRAGRGCLYITLSESKRELLSVAERHGWSLDGVEIFELVPPELSLDPKQQQSLVHSSDLELGETVHMAMAEIERVKPAACGLRQPVGDPAAVAGLAALPPPGARAQEASFCSTTPRS